MVRNNARMMDKYDPLGGNIHPLFQYSEAQFFGSSARSVCISIL
jgi:hypothetical protein